MKNLVALSLLLLAACSGRGKDEWSEYRATLPPDQASYMAMVDQTGQVLDVLTQNIDKVMNRAKEFLDKFAGGHDQKGMTLRAQGENFTYKITAGEFHDEYDVHVMCAQKGEPDSEHAYRNARICAYFMETGELPYPELVRK